MPPKATKKTVDKVAAKIVEDKTFGLKNKNKSKKVQQFVQSVQKQAKDAAMAKTMGKAGADEALRKEKARKEKEALEAAEKEMMALLRASIKQPKLEPGVDPKSVLCEFFKAGCCDKGDKCKYSHDLTVGRKSAKIDLYTDSRDLKKEGEEETNADWDQAKLEEVVRTKHGAEGATGGAAAATKGVPTRTEIVCKYFLDAIEKEQYGWFWKCPNGADCKYRHALPPGYVYKTKKDRELEAAAKAAEADAATSGIEEAIEEERKKLPTTGLTPVTAESFAAWKKRREERRAAELEAKRIEEAKKTGTKGYSVLSGRALFSFDPSLFVDDDAADAEVYEVKDREPEEDETSAAGGAGGAAASGVVGDADAFLDGDEGDLDGLMASDDEDEEDGEEGGDEEEGDDDEEGEEDDGGAAGGAGASS